MQARYVTAFEHQPIPIGGKAAETALTPDEADYLTLLGELRPGFCQRGHRSIRLAQFSGVVSLGDRVLEILPKVDEFAPPDECRGVLLRLLRAAEQFPPFRHLSVGHHLRHAPLLEVFIAAFFDVVFEIVRGGLLRQYQQREEDLRVVRGRIVASRQFATHSNRLDRVACQFDDLTADNVWNRLIKTGLLALRPWIASVELNRRWVELMVVFDEVNPPRVDARALTRLVFDRYAARYRTAIDWVRWILALLSPALRAGENAAPGLLFDMNLLFQSAVTSVLRRQPNVGSSLQVQSEATGRHLAFVSESSGRRAFGLRPDLMIWQNSDLARIADTKWKRLAVSKAGYLMPTEADIYQMNAYAAAFQCERLALIYPWHSGLAAAKSTSFELPQIGTLRPVVDVVCVDVHDDSFRLVSGQDTSDYRVLLGIVAGSTPRHPRVLSAGG
jgi:5-methylcytosine-specific restriction enzyme subunit McrC